MREVIFQESGMKNFGPYIDPMVLPFPNDKLSLITGPNGIGKTMALDSIPFTLYGITSKKAKGDDVVNNVIGKNCKTWVKFKVNDNQYIITRYHKYTRFGNTVILNKNGKDIKKGQREVLPEIEKLICPQKSFMNTLMFGQKVKDFFTDLVDSDKKEIFRKILGLEQYLSYYKYVSDLLKELAGVENNLKNKIEVDKGLYEDTTTQIKTFLDLKSKFYENQKESIANLEKSIKDNERLLSNWANTLDKLKIDSENIKGIIEDLSKIQNELSSFEQTYSSELDKLEKQAEMKKLELTNDADKSKAKISADFSEQLKTLNDKLNNITQKINDQNTNNQQTKHEIELKISKLITEQKSISKEINEITNNVLESDISICPTCRQEITELTKNELITKIENLKVNFENNNKEIETLTYKNSELDNQLNLQLKILNKEKYELNLKLTNLAVEENDLKLEVEKKLNDLKLKVDLLVKQQKSKILERKSKEQKELLEKEKNLILRKEKQEKIDKNIESVKSTIFYLENDIKTATSQLERERETDYDETQLNSYINKKQNLEVSISEKENELIGMERKTKIYEFWKSGFSSTGIPSMLIDDSIPFMNDKISKYLDLLTNGRYIVSFDTLDETKAGEYRDKISVHVVDTETKANSRVQLSGGQTRIIDIATILTLGDLQANIQDIKFNILLFDEIFDALDYDNATYVSKVLNKLKLGKSIYVISHQIQDQLEPDEHLEFLGVKK